MPSKFSRKKHSQPVATSSSNAKHGRIYPDLNVIAFHFDGQALPGKDSPQMLFLTIEGYPENTVKNAIYGKNMPVNAAFLKAVDPVIWDFKMGEDGKNEIKNKRDYPRHCLAIIMTQEAFGDPASGDVYSKGEIEAWINATYIPAVNTLAEFKNGGPHLNSQDWYNPIRSFSEIFSDNTIASLLTHAFCKGPDKFAVNAKALLQAEKGVLCAAYPPGSLTEEFVKAYSLKKEHVHPQDYDKVPEGPLDKYLSPTKNNRSASPPGNTGTTQAASFTGDKDSKEETPAGTNDKNPAKITPATTVEIKQEKVEDENGTKRSLQLNDSDDVVDLDAKKPKIGTKTTGLDNDEESEYQSDAISDNSVVLSWDTPNSKGQILTQLSASSRSSHTQATQAAQKKGKEHERTKKEVSKPPKKKKTTNNKKKHAKGTDNG